ncbi:glycosyltransferase family 4 protein [Gonapodya prolifera JEL478]|uniref:Glycosyltransferase family 4 protein n=1 Tax=Gonapodya prolifera (strain JEL478) TaxID=1344416 RepID=A0A139AN85_GONPJ|nr:glycosyltransferase family 4 protein [Gonapodya prolifera JEL478]|eukprot:KXS17955.1 glycosyltransferase family 4 protein [Gonapodya prolifera JEL478]
MPSYNLTCDWEWRSGRVAWALHARVAVSKHLKSYLLEVVRAGHTALCKPITVNESIVGRAFASPLEEQHKIHVIPPPFVPAQGRKLSPSNTSDLVRSGPIVLFVGRLDEQKDPMLWLDVGSFILKNASHSQPRLVIAGGGPMEREVMERLYGLNEAQTTVYGEEPSDFHRYVDLLGPQSRENLTRIFTRGDSVLLSTSRNEGVPLVLIDAAANGVPVVTLQCGAIEEIFDRLPTPTFVPETPRTHAVKRHALGSIVALNCIALAGMNSGDRHRVVETLAKEVMWWLSKLKERGTAHFLKEKRSSILNVRTTFGVDRFNREWRELLAELFK